MNLQALLIRASVAVVVGLALATAIAFDRAKPTASLAPASAIPAHAKGSTAAAPVLLPTIHVRPTASQRVAAAVSLPAAPAETNTVMHAVLHDDAATAIGSELRLDMPYYSFGKVLPRIRKE